MVCRGMVDTQRDGVQAVTTAEETTHSSLLPSFVPTVLYPRWHKITHHLGRLPNADYSMTKKLYDSYDAFSESSRRHGSNAAVFGAAVEISSFKNRGGSCVTYVLTLARANRREPRVCTVAVTGRATSRSHSSIRMTVPVATTT